MDIRPTHRALLSRLLPDDDPDDLAVRRGPFHHVVIGSDRVVCLPRTRAAAARLPGSALTRMRGEPLAAGMLDDARPAGTVAAFAPQQALSAIHDGDEQELAKGLADYR